MLQPETSKNLETDHLSRLIEKQTEQLACVEERIELWNKYRKDYLDLKTLLMNMPDKIRHPHRIPIAGSKLALVDGYIIHTNEINVLLGDQLFAMRSAKQACQIIDRRLHNVDQMLKQNEETRKKICDWLKVTSEHKQEKEEFVEIIETIGSSQTTTGDRP